MIETVAKKALRQSVRELLLITKNATRAIRKGEPAAVSKVARAACDALEKTRPFAAVKTDRSLSTGDLCQVLEAILDTTVFATFEEGHALVMQEKLGAPRTGKARLEFSQGAMSRR